MMPKNRLSLNNMVVIMDQYAMCVHFVERECQTDFGLLFSQLTHGMWLLRQFVKTGLDADDAITRFGDEHRIAHISRLVRGLLKSIRLQHFDAISLFLPTGVTSALMCPLLQRLRFTRKHSSRDTILDMETREGLILLSAIPSRDEHQR